MIASLEVCQEITQPQNTLTRMRSGLHPGKRMGSDDKYKTVIITERRRRRWWWWGKEEKKKGKGEAEFG